MARTLSNVARTAQFQPPLDRFNNSGYVFYNRSPLHPVDLDVWRRRVEDAEAYAVPVPGLRQQLRQAVVDLAAWVRNHRYLVLVDLARGEPTIALLLLWEVDHGQPFPTQGAGERSDVLARFTTRLKAKVAQDAELRTWLQFDEVQRPMQPGLVEVRYTRWSVQVRRPGAGEPLGWYDDFVQRWQAYLASHTRAARTRNVQEHSSSEAPSLQTPVYPLAAQSHLIE
jgi:hypothetical protein